jgi:N utilization substance protein B
MSNRRLGRLRAVQALFQIDLINVSKEEALQSVVEEEEEITPFMDELVEGTLNNKSEIDEILIENLENWTIDRVGNVDRTILRLAVYEMKYDEDTPMNVTFNEAIELAKAFGGEESGRFVNAVLSNIIKIIDKKS